MTVQDDDLVDVEARLRDALAPFGGTGLPPLTARAAVERGRRLRRVRRIAATAAPAVAAVLVVATALGIGVATRSGDGAPTGPALGGRGWQRAADAPLSPRTGAWVLPLGSDRVLVLGGTTEAPCPPTAYCVAPQSQARLPRDGALYDVRTNTWRRIADSPVPVGSDATAVVGDTVYALTNPTQYGTDAVDTGERTLLAWSAVDDRWTRLPAPQAQVIGLVALEDGRLLAYGHAHDAGIAPDLVFDPATRAWTPLPEDPWPGTQARQVVPVAGGAVLFAERPVEGASYQAWLMARWDAATDAWTRLPDPGLVDSTPGWFAVGDRLVNPSTETVDAGASGTRRTGGVYAPSTGTWATVPPWTPAPGVQPTAAGAGRVVAQGGVLDVATRRWSPMPPRPGDRAELSGCSVTPSGLFVEFGGVRAEGEGAWRQDAVTNELWVLRLP